MNEEIYKLLKEFFGFSEFRPLQKDSISSTLDKKDSLTILPTGGGKSLCFQLPAIYFYKQNRQMAIVISPLIALINDQIHNLQNNNISAEKITSEQSDFEISEVQRKVFNGEVSLLYISPERATCGVLGICCII
jgi:ATP-dependent DNA helicase RecQ